MVRFAGGERQPPARAGEGGPGTGGIPGQPWDPMICQARRWRRLTGGFVLVALAGTSGGARASDPLPEWARRAIDADTPRWHPGSPGVMLLDSTQFRFLPVGTETGGAAASMGDGRRMSIVTRGAVLLNGDSERNW